MSIKIKDEWLQSNGLYKCPYCSKECKKHGIGIHIWRQHTEEGKDFDPNKGYKNGRQIWNKGLTKKTDERIKKYSKTLSDNTKNKKRKPLSEEHKRHISESAKRYYSEHPDKVVYLKQNAYNYNFLENYLKNYMESNGIIDFIYKYRNGKYEYDFAIPSIKLDIEVDGKLHNQFKVKNKDIERDKWSNSQGWEVLRFTSDEIRKDINNVIIKIKDKIKNMNT